MAKNVRIMGHRSSKTSQNRSPNFTAAALMRRICISLFSFTNCSPTFSTQRVENLGYSHGRITACFYAFWTTRLATGMRGKPCQKGGASVHWIGIFPPSTITAC